MSGDIKQRMIERTAVLLATKGLQGTSFSEVLAASGAPRGSLYHHFPGGKDELVLAALQRASEQMMSALENGEGHSPAEIARRFIVLWRAVLEASHLSAGCAIVAVTVAAEAPPLMARVAEIFRNVRTRLAALFAGGGIAPKRAEALAAGLVAACEGAVILARAEKSFAPFDLVTAEQLVAIEAAMGRS
jgi:AcrR family transcriptional regulator